MAADGAIRRRNHANATQATVVLIAPSLIASATVPATALATLLECASVTMAGPAWIAHASCATGAPATVLARVTGFVNAIFRGRTGTVPFVCALAAAVVMERASMEHACATPVGPQMIAPYLFALPIHRRSSETILMFCWIVQTIAVVMEVVNLEFAFATWTTTVLVVTCILAV